MSRKITRAALLLALMLLFQSLRLIIPVPPFISMFVIGSAVNACLLLAVEIVGWQAALLLAVAAPVVAAAQQFLPSPLLILPVAAANLIYAGLYALLFRYRRWLAVLAAAGMKMLGLYGLSTLLLQWLQIPDKLALALKLMFSYPQLITGILGGILCFIIGKKVLKREVAG
ncbi:hypothetical protein SDC9_202809 [bioreactor metagenome]|uniref:ECF transporter S component n=1 Tax=bioreactor metagenome TaxID=1076179 RepID=A0A645IW75_9ZZZZ